VVNVLPDITLQLDAQPMVSDMEAMDAEITSVSNPAGGIRYVWQWNMRQIQANKAWAAGYLGSSTITVAILDSGIDYDGYDANGQVDLARSKSFVASDDAYITDHFPGRNFIDDLNGHGSNVASQVSSRATIFAGVTSRVKLMGVKVLGRNGAGTLSSVLNGIIWAADHDADVANMSVGVYGGVIKSGNGDFMGIVNKVFNYAHRMGVVMVVAAGNDGDDMDNDGLNFRAYCEAPHVICVGATAPSASTNPLSGPWTNPDAFADYSNYGKTALTVAAPGGSNKGWVPSVCARHIVVAGTDGAPDTYPCNAPPGFFSYIGYAGTSQAAPHVAGLAALLVERLGKNNPDAVKDALINSVDDLGAPGKDDYYGWGRINVAKALGL
jgi:subtilisin family serine protease